MKLNIAQNTGKLTGRVIGATKTAPTKTKKGIVSVKEQFLAGFNTGISRNS